MKISNEARERIAGCEAELTRCFAAIDQTAARTQERVLEAFLTNRVSPRHFAPTFGYGYDDEGRDTLDKVFAQALQAEDALVRPQIANGTQAIFLAVSGLVEPGDTILFASGKPYDTLQGAVGFTGDEPNSLKRMGVRLTTVPLIGSELDDAAILKAAAEPSVRILYVQRSRGYEWRAGVALSSMQRLFAKVRQLRSDIWIFVDNCYGEFVEAEEPTAVGADLMAGSLIKNIGGGLAPTGGYIAGRRELIGRVANRLTVPGTGREVGSYAASYRPFYQGLFLAPHTTAQCLKSAVLFARLFEDLGFETLPRFDDVRHDIVQSVRMDGKDSLIAFCRAIQAASPVDGYVVPEPWPMPGYSDPVIMAAGTFVQGATGELSADAPLREPYTAYLQGALCYEHARLAAMLTADALTK